MNLATDDELITDMCAVRRQLGYISYFAYNSYGFYRANTVANRFGSWLKACAAAGLTPSRKNRAVRETVKRMCIACDVSFPSPKDDPSCRRCAKCKQQAYLAESIPDGWELAL